MVTAGKVDLVTGGSGGLGSVHCLSLAAAGYKVAVAAHSQLEKAQEIADKIETVFIFQINIGNYNIDGMRSDDFDCFRDGEEPLCDHALYLSRRSGPARPRKRPRT